MRGRNDLIDSFSSSMTITVLSIDDERLGYISHILFYIHVLSCPVLSYLHMYIYTTR